MPTSLLVLNHLNADIANWSRHWFEQNLLALTEDGECQLMIDATSEMSPVCEARLRAFQIFLGQDARGSRADVPLELRDHSDGEGREGWSGVRFN
jgi:hypothetical protein